MTPRARDLENAATPAAVTPAAVIRAAVTRVAVSGPIRAASNGALAKDTAAIPVVPLRSATLRGSFRSLAIAGLLLGGCQGAPPAVAEPGSPGVIRTGVVEHTVSRGETLHSIARTYAVTVGALVGANPAVDPDRLRVGERLSIPRRKPEIRRVETVGGTP